MNVPCLLVEGVEALSVGHAQVAPRKGVEGSNRAAPVRNVRQVAPGAASRHKQPVGFSAASVS